MEANQHLTFHCTEGLTELITLGRTLKHRAGDLAYFRLISHQYGLRAINGRLEHLRGPALGIPKPHSITSPAASSKPVDSDPNHTPTIKSP